MAAWFGESWNAPACDPLRHWETPIGEPCFDCGNPIDEDDRGMLIPLADGSGTPPIKPWHLECFLVNIGFDPEAVKGCNKPGNDPYARIMNP